MSPLDQDAALSQGTVSNGVMNYGPPGQGASRRTDAAYEPELEGSSYQAAPITSLALARWTWAVAGLLIGTLLGFLSATGGGWKATSTLQINSEDPNALKALGQTYQASALSDKVLGDAATALAKDDNFVKKNCAKVDKNSLGASITPAWQTDTSLVDITATDPIGACAGYKATAVAQAVRAKVEADALEAIKNHTRDVQKVMASNTVGPVTSDAETSRLTQLGQDLGAQQSAQLAAKQSVTVIVAAVALPAGPDRNTSALLGAAGGAFLGALAAVVAGAGRRKPHSPRELAALAPDLVVRTTVQAGELAGRVLETDRRSVAVLAMPDTRFAATQLAMAIAHHLRTHGATVAIVDRVSEFNPSSATEDRLWALRRDVRRNIPANFSADILVVVCGADEEALSLIAGQSDLLVAVVAKPRKTALADIRRTVDAVRVSEPVVVLAR
jgi:hypothetical protein